MPSGKIHDRITLWSLPWVVGLSFATTRSGELTLIVAGGFLFGGLMFGPDLDIYSIQFKRWGWLRWIWLPYQKCLRHRSPLSHGPIIGTALRLLYLSAIVALVAGGAIALVGQFLRVPIDSQAIVEEGILRLSAHRWEAIALFLGLELGAMSHYLADWTGSTYKRWRKRGAIAAFFKPKKKPKRKSSRRPK